MEKIVILTDLGRFVAYKLQTDPDGLESPRMEMVRCMDCPDARTRTTDKVSDSAGRFRRAGKAENGTRAGYGEHHRMQSEHRKRIIKMAAEQIRDVLSEAGFPQWHLAAEKTINKPLVDSLSPEIRALLRKNIKSDLTRLSKTDVMSRFIH